MRFFRANFWCGMNAPLSLCAAGNLDARTIGTS
jgi:hypothetical protein